MNRIAGVQVTSGGVADAAAISVGGAGVTLDMIEIGQHRRAVELAPGASMTMNGSRVGVGASLVTVPDTSQASFTNNIFVRNGASADPAIVAGGTSRLTLTGNVFSGFDPEIVRGLSAARRREILAGNIVVPPAQPPRPSPRRNGENHD